MILKLFEFLKPVMPYLAAARRSIATASLQWLRRSGSNASTARTPDEHDVLDDSRLTQFLLSHRQVIRWLVEATHCTYPQFSKA